MIYPQFLRMCIIWKAAEWKHRTDKAEKVQVLSRPLKFKEWTKYKLSLFGLMDF
jgi:hypothetical protein